MMTARQHSHLHTEWMHQFPQLKSLSDFDQNLRNNVAQDRFKIEMNEMECNIIHCHCYGLILWGLGGSKGASFLKLKMNKSDQSTIQSENH